MLSATIPRLTGVWKGFRRLVFGIRAAESAPAVRPYAWESSYPTGLDWELDVTPRPLYALLDDAVAQFPDRPCLEFLGKRYSYAEVGELVSKAAKGLREIGVGKGVKVGLFLPNSPYYVISYFAILKAGGTVVNFNPLYAEREVRRQINDSGTRVMITMNLRSLYPKVAGRLADSCLRKVVVCSMGAALRLPDKALFAIFKRSEVASIPSDEQHVRFEKLIANHGDFEPAIVDPRRDCALLQFTGGTTGVPKGAALTHAAIYSNAVQTRAWAQGIEPGQEKVVAVLPLFHVFGMTGVMTVGLMCGSEILLQPHFKVGDVLRLIEKYQATIFFGVPTMYSAINGHRGERDAREVDLSSLRFCVSGGAPLPADIKENFERLSGCTLVEGYGLTEAAPVCTINPIDGVNKIGSAGLPVPGTVVEIVALDDPYLVLPCDEVGEICVSGPQVMTGYARHSEETGEVLRNGRLQTGDVGYMDAEGYLFILDRIKDLIITGGFNVYPRMIEEAVLLHPDVVEAAVCGVPNKHRGETIKAYVVLREGCELRSSELRAFLQDKLANFEIPRQVKVVDEIPKTMLGKPLRRKLIAAELKARNGGAGVRVEDDEEETEQCTAADDMAPKDMAPKDKAPKDKAPKDKEDHRAA